MQQPIHTHILHTLHAAKKVIITTHRDPDGDAMGSALGMAHYLGSKAIVLLPTPAPENLMWMPGAQDCIVFSPGAPLPEHDTIIVLDLNTLGRLAELGEAITHSNANIINIDHHTHPQDFAQLAWVDTTFAATCAMLARLFIATGADISANVATCLFTGIMTDTGGFRFPRTTAELFSDVSKLVSFGADPVSISDNVLNCNSIERTQLLGEVLANMRFYKNNQFCVMLVTAELLKKYSVSHTELDGFVHFTLSISGVRAGLLIVELPTQIKLSFRSKGGVHVHEIAAHYGGGGHVHAAGARINSRPVVELIQEIVEKIVL